MKGVIINAKKKKKEMAIARTAKDTVTMAINITNSCDDVAEDNDCDDNYNYPLQMLSN